MPNDQIRKTEVLNAGDADIFNDQDSVFESDVNDNGLADDSDYAYQIELADDALALCESMMANAEYEYYIYVTYEAPVEDYWDALVEEANLEGW